MYKLTTFLFLLLLSTTTMAQSDENTTSQAILTEKIIQQDLARFDKNNDGIIDTADLVQIARPNLFPEHLVGHTWIVAASFTASEGNMIPVSYPFAISIQADKAIVTQISGYNPTKSVLQQTKAEQDFISGWQRPVYALSGMIPSGTVFTLSVESAQVFTIESQEFQISADSYSNPTGKELAKKWIIEIDKQALYAADYNHGKIIEQTSGIFEDKIVSSIGHIYMVPFSPASANE
ncbi:MAG: hypothetical protein HQK75_11730 [Candidatus Magnetomorum sp.]|nr:hypothetical protein [Candidatus Magnetomorum sp.]